MNEVVKVNGSTDLTAGGVNPFSQAGSAMGGSQGAFLKFSGNDGRWTFGKDGEELEHGTQVAVLMSEFKRGWICWNGGDVKKEIMVDVSTGQQPPLEQELEDFGPYPGEMDGWSKQASVHLKTLDDGEDFTFKTLSKSGVMALGRLSSIYGKNMGIKVDSLGVPLIPVVELGSSEFELKNMPGVKKHAPNLKVVDWVPMAELEVMFGAPPEEEEDLDDAPEPSEEEEAPTQRPKRAPRDGRRGSQYTQ